MRRSLRRERQQRKEALEQQTATSEILKVISSSPTDVQPVFDTIIRNAVQLCDGTTGVVFRYDGEMMSVGALYGLDAAAEKMFHDAFPQRASRDNPAARAVVERAIVNCPDVFASDFSNAVKERARASRYRSNLAVPMMREGVPIGVIIVGRRTVGSYPESYVALMKTFADQAVIAIENVRLFNETKEALDQQTATSEILGVISRSPTDLTPVFDAILKSALQLCEAHLGHLHLYDGEFYRTVATRGATAEFAKYIAERGPYKSEGNLARATVERRPVHIPDLRTSPGYLARKPHTVKFVELGGARTALDVPLLKEDKVLGVLVIYRPEVRPFTEKQLALLQTFAHQAVIAMENVRLFNETKESLDQQKASADVLGVISSSIADTKPVFDKILESCERLFEGHFMGIGLVGEDRCIHIVARRGPGAIDLQKEVSTVPFTKDSGTGLAILERRVVHYPDVFGQTDVAPSVRRGAEKGGFKSIVFAPMFWDDKGIGAIWVGRTVTGPFTEKQITLLKTFADQAVIAIQNARLFREIQEKSAQLEAANKHKSDFLANMSHELRTPLNAIIGFSEGLMERMFGDLNEKQLEYQKDIHESGKHLLSLINDILDLSKIEAGKMELELSSFHLPTAVSNAVTLVRERAHRHGIALRVDIDPRLGEFKADERKLKQVLLNLLSNAVKFTPDGGRVDVSAKLDTDKVEIAVKDTGVGIAPEDQASLFEEFKQLGKDSSRKAEGTGLGLALTKRLVELHGGEISVQSVIGEGSTFRVNLPLRR